jgi:hypothetical protein
MYVFTRKVSQSERNRFNRRGISVIDLADEADSSYEDLLTRLLSEIAERISDRSIRVLQEQDAPAAESFLPGSAVAAIVLFDIPMNQLRLYREYLFPVVERYDLTPVAVGEITDADSIDAAVETLRDRAVCIVAEDDPDTWSIERPPPREDWTLPESNGADAVPTPPRFLVSSRSEVRVDDASRDILTRIEQEWLNLSTTFENWFRGTKSIEVRRKYLENEPRRLLENGDHRTAIGVAVGLLEAALKRRYRANLSRSRLPTRTLLEKARESGLFASMSTETEAIIELAMYQRISATIEAQLELNIAAEDAANVVQAIEVVLELLKSTT